MKSASRLEPLLKLPCDRYGLASGAARTWRQAGGNCRHRHPVARLRRLFRRRRVENRILEPVSEIARAAAFAARLRRLALAFAAARRASHADVKVIVMAPPRPDLRKPAAVALGLTTQCLLDGGVDEDALHARFLRGVANDRNMTRRKDLGIDVEPIVAHHHHRRHFLAILARQHMVRHRRQPDVGIEPDLMAGMAAQRRAAARLRRCRRPVCRASRHPCAP